MLKKGFIRAFGVVTLATILVRVAGLAREMTSANYFGTTLVYDAFLLAFMIPNFLRGVLAEGGLNSAFIPVFSEYLGPERRPEAQKVVSDTIGASLLATLALSVLVMLAAGAARFFPISHKAFLILSFLRFTIFYLVFISLAALVMGVLNSLGHFTAPALAPLGPDFFWILSLVLAAGRFNLGLTGRTYCLIGGLLLGGAAQLAIALPAFHRRGFRLRPSLDFRNPALVRMGRLLLPVLVGVAVTPINLMVDYFLASLISPGMVSSLWYANRLVQLPIGVFGVAIATVALPSLSRLAAEGDLPKLKQTLNFSMQLNFLLVIPAALGLVFFREPIIRVFFERGLFTSRSTAATGFALLFYSMGLFAYTGGILLTRAFYALRDTVTPVRVGLLSILVNVGLDLLLMGPLRQGGIALATALVGTLNFFLLYHLLRRRIGPLDGKLVLRKALGVLLISGLAVLAAWRCLRAARHLGPLLSLLAAFAGGLAAYAAAYWLLLHRRYRERPSA